MGVERATSLARPGAARASKCAEADSLRSGIDPSARLAPSAAPGTGSAIHRGGVQGWAARHPVTAFLVLAFCLAYPVMALPILASHGVIASWSMPQLPGVDTERVASVLLVFVALLPAAVIVTWLADGANGAHGLMRRTFRWRIGSGWWVLVVAGLPALTLTLAVLFGDTITRVEIIPFVAAQVMGLLVNLVLINIWEETAWAGLVQSRLERKHGLVTAALLTAVPFALVHSILAVALRHTMFHRSNNDEGVVAGMVDGDGRKLAGLVAVLVMTAVVAVIARRRLGHSERLALDTAHLDSPQPAKKASS